jgi:poly-beta-1,6-N-acetyl-D-glucosamine synthase
VVLHIAVGAWSKNANGTIGQLMMAHTSSTIPLPPATFGARPTPRIALITPLRDEEGYIEAMIESIIAQSVRPTKWLIVDDGSTDKTPVIVRRYCERFDFIELLQLPPRTERRPGGEGAIAAALNSLDLSQFDFLARFDADLLFENDYFERILAKFVENPQLGIAGGGLYINRNGRLIPEQAPEYHVRGALKMYRRECFNELGGLATYIGWDTIDEVSAWSRGWKTSSFMDIRVIHRRPTGEGMQAVRIYRERGRAEYLTWSHPVFVTFKAARMASTKPRNALSFMSGFLSCYRHGQARLQSLDFKRTRRKQQMDRMFSSLLPEILRRRFEKDGSL